MRRPACIGTLGLSSGLSSNAGVSPTFVAATDLNGEARADLLVVSYDSGSVSVYLNQGNGTFALRSATLWAPPSWSGGPQLTRVATGDLAG